MNDYFTPILNYSIVLLENKEKLGKKIAETYLSEYESESDWAIHLAQIAKTKQKENSVNFEFGGFEIGASEKELFQKWKKPESKNVKEFTIQNEDETFTKKIIQYPNYAARVIIEKEKVIQVEFNGKKSPKINGKISIGDMKSKILKEIGKPKVESKTHLLYSYTTKEKRKQYLRLEFSSEKLIRAIVY